MSYEIDSSKYQIKPERSVQTNGTTSESAAQNASSVEVFNNSLPTTEENKNNFENIDIDELTKKYKKNPIAVLNELGINFDKNQIEQLKLFLKDKKSLKSFLNLIKENGSLKPGDIVAAVEKVSKYQPKNIGGRIGNFFKTLFKEGVSDAIEVAKSETVYYAGKLGENMDEVRTERQDFSSETVVDISDTMTQQPETKENVMHFVVKENKDGSKLYTEQDVLQARNIIVENPDDANEFTANAAELEAIQDTNGNIKYKGSTIINVDEKMIKNKEVKSTMMNVAKKSDMTDEYLINTTDNLAKNHAMADAIDFLATAKDENGKDRFSAQNVSTESTYLKDKVRDFCDKYIDDIKEIASHSHITGDDAIRITHNTTEHPEIKQSVIEALRNKKNTSEQVREYAHKLANKIKNEEQQNEQNSAVSESRQNTATVIESNKINKQNKNTTETKNTTTPISNSGADVSSKINFLKQSQVGIAPVQQNFALDETNAANITERAVIGGQVYERSVVLKALTKKFGTAAEKVLNAIEKDPSFIDLMKQYNGNQVIVNALIDDPYLVTKIKKAGGSLSINEIADIVKLCTDATSTDVMLEALQNYSPAEAMKITRQSKIFNMKDDALSILSKSGSSVTSKKNQLEELYFTGGKRTEIIG